MKKWIVLTLIACAASAQAAGIDWKGDWTEKEYIKNTRKQIENKGRKWIPTDEELKKKFAELDTNKDDKVSPAERQAGAKK